MRTPAGRENRRIGAPRAKLTAPSTIERSLISSASQRNANRWTPFTIMNEKVFSHSSRKRREPEAEKVCRLSLPELALKEAAGSTGSVLLAIGAMPSHAGGNPHQASLGF